MTALEYNAAVMGQFTLQRLTATTSALTGTDTGTTAKLHDIIAPFVFKFLSIGWVIIIILPAYFFVKQFL